MSNALSGAPMRSGLQLLAKQGQTRAGAKAPAGFGVIKCADSASCSRAVHRAGQHCRRGWRRVVFGVRAHHPARINPVAERANDPEQFVMAEPGISSRLDDEVRCFVDGVSRSVNEVVQAAAVARSIEEGIPLRSYGGAPNRRCCSKREPASADRCLWSFYRKAETVLPPEAFDTSQPLLPLPDLPTLPLPSNRH